MTGSILQISVSPGGVPKHAVPVGILTPARTRRRPPCASRHSRRPATSRPPHHRRRHRRAEQRGLPLIHGALGENLTTRGLDRRDWRAGQRWRIGAGSRHRDHQDAARLAQTLNRLRRGSSKARSTTHVVKAGDPSSPNWGLSGFYASRRATRHHPPRRCNRR